MLWFVVSCWLCGVFAYSDFGFLVLFDCSTCVAWALVWINFGCGFAGCWLVDWFDCATLVSVCSTLCSLGGACGLRLLFG